MRTEIIGESRRHERTCNIPHRSSAAAIVIAAFTINGARLFGHADRLGSLEVGKLADVVVLDQNIVELARSGQAQRIGSTGVTLTVFDGEIVYDAVTTP